LTPLPAKAVFPSMGDNPFLFIATAHLLTRRETRKRSKQWNVYLSLRQLEELSPQRQFFTEGLANNSV